MNSSVNPITPPSPREILVVREGSGRITWDRIGPALWEPVDVWPQPHHVDMVHSHLDLGGRVLVLLDDSVDSRSVAAGDGAVRVPVLAQEIIGAPEHVKALCERDDERDDAADDLVELAVPLLDWLPETLRAQGLRTIGTLGSTSHCSGVADSADHDQVRYSRINRPRTPSAFDVDSAARTAFPQTAHENAMALGLRLLNRPVERAQLPAQPTRSRRDVAA
jgi:hypothetical protein